MIEEPTRRIHEDPEFARLVEASEKDGPSAAQMNAARSRATQLALSSRGAAWGGWKTGVALGLSVVGVAVLGVVARLDAVPSHGAPTASVVPPPPTVVETSPPATAIRTVSVDDLAAAPDAPYAARPPAPLRAAAPPDRSANARSTFDDELALVSTARSSLEAKDVRTCLKAVESYERRFRSGLFAQEVEVIHIEVLALSGERDRARAWAQRFLATNATSPYTNRVRSLLERTEN